VIERPPLSEARRCFDRLVDLQKLVEWEAGLAPSASAFTSDGGSNKNIVIGQGLSGGRASLVRAIFVFGKFS
jgi:hypothetical protein